MWNNKNEPMTNMWHYFFSPVHPVRFTLSPEAITDRKTACTHTTERERWQVYTLLDSMAQNVITNDETIQKHCALHWQQVCSFLFFFLFHSTVSFDLPRPLGSLIYSVIELHSLQSLERTHTSSTQHSLIDDIRYIHLVSYSLFPLLNLVDCIRGNKVNLLTLLHSREKLWGVQVNLSPSLFFSLFPTKLIIWSICIHFV